MSDSKATKAQNLARIRDNQRRSRARRKEYLQELEAKLRNCEQMGIEASAEIQSAARKVLDENRKLRALLRERGVPESDIMAVLGCSDRSLEQASAAPTLTAMLEQRKRPCGGLSGDESPSSPTPSTTIIFPSTTSVAPIAIPTQRTAALSSNESHSPQSMASSVETPPGYHGTPFYPLSMTPAPELKAECMTPFSYSFDQPIPTAWSFPNDTSYHPEPMAYFNTSSCVDAANIIRSMRVEVGSELEADLGCRALGQDCYVDNSLVFNVMDKYSATGMI